TKQKESIDEEATEMLKEKQRIEKEFDFLNRLGEWIISSKERYKSQPSESLREEINKQVAIRRARVDACERDKAAHNKRVEAHNARAKELQAEAESVKKTAETKVDDKDIRKRTYGNEPNRGGPKGEFYWGDEVLTVASAQS